MLLRATTRQAVPSTTINLACVMLFCLNTENADVPDEFQELHADVSPYPYMSWLLRKGIISVTAHPVRQPGGAYFPVCLQ